MDGSGWVKPILETVVLFSQRTTLSPHTHTTDQSLHLLFTVVATTTRTDEVPLWLYTTQLITHNCASFPYWFAADLNAPHGNYSLVVKIFKIFAMGRIISMHLHLSPREVYFFEDIALFTHGMCPGFIGVYTEALNAARTQGLHRLVIDMCGARRKEYWPR